MSPEVIAENGIAITEQLARELVKGKCLPQLLSRPFGRQVDRHNEVKNATAVMGQYQQHVKHLETEVDGGQLLGVILQECAPRLRRPLAEIRRPCWQAAAVVGQAEGYWNDRNKAN